MKRRKCTASMHHHEPFREPVHASGDEPAQSAHGLDPVHEARLPLKPRPASHCEVLT